MTTGSGSLAAMAIMETEYKDGMTQEEAKKLVIKCIEAGIYHDLGSGSNVDVCVISNGHVDFFRNIKSDNKKMFGKPGGYIFEKGSTPVTETFRYPIVVEQGQAPMDLS